MIEWEVIPQSPDFEDRKVRLVVFGILQIILGSIFILIAALAIFGMITSAAARKDIGVQRIIFSVLMLSLVAIWFIWVGIGSIKTRRWARALILVSSWLWLICGTLGFVFMLRFLPAMYDKMAENGQIPKTDVMAIKCAVMTFMAVLYVIIPGLLVLFYSGRKVKATCEDRDSKVRWTDKCPLPVLAISMASVCGAILMLGMGRHNWAIPYFGSVLNGMPGAIVISVLILLLVYTAYGTYKLNIKAWWCVLLVIIGWSLSAIITFSRVDIQTYYDKMSFSGKQLELMKQYGDMLMSNVKLFFCVWAVIAIAYLLYIRKYFKSISQKGNLI